MSRFDRENPEREDPYEDLRSQADYRRKAVREGTLIPCAHCGALSHRRWCSASCHKAEDGPDE